jgi:hypothetical protein
MNARTENQSRKDGITSAIGVLVLLLSAATGSASTMLVMGGIGLIAISILYRQQLGRAAWLAMTVSAAIAVVTAVAITIV